jgi:hypothetical protein
LNLN